MKKCLLIFMVLVLVGCFSFGKKLATLEGLGKPGLIIVGNDRIFINEGASISIYSAGDFKLLKKFGTMGEGPQEFKVHPNLNRGGVRINIEGDTLVINSMGKLSYFTMDGVFQEEFKIPFSASYYLPLEKKFAAIGYAHDDNKDYYTIDIYSHDLTEKKEISRFLALQVDKQINPVTIMKMPGLYVCNKKIFVGDDSRGIIYIFNENGNKINEISQQYERIKVTKDRKKRYEEFFSTDPRFKDRYQRDLSDNMIKYPDYFPPIRDFCVADDQIYVMTYKEVGTDSEVYILDSNGTLLKKSFYPIQEMNGAELYPYYITKGTLYQLIENPDIEEWELHAIDIK